LGVCSWVSVSRVGCRDSPRSRASEPPSDSAMSGGFRCRSPARQVRTDRVMPAGETRSPLDLSLCGHASTGNRTRFVWWTPQESPPESSVIVHRARPVRRGVHHRAAVLRLTVLRSGSLAAVARSRRSCAKCTDGLVCVAAGPFGAQVVAQPSEVVFQDSGPHFPVAPARPATGPSNARLDDPREGGGVVPTGHVDFRADRAVHGGPGRPAFVRTVSRPQGAAGSMTCRWWLMFQVAQARIGPGASPSSQLDEAIPVASRPIASATDRESAWNCPPRSLLSGVSTAQWYWSNREGYADREEGG